MCGEMHSAQMGLQWGGTALPGAAAPLHLGVPFQQDSVLVSASVAPYHPELDQQACTGHALSGEKHAEKENSA